MNNNTNDDPYGWFHHGYDTAEPIVKQLVLSGDDFNNNIKTIAIPAVAAMSREDLETVAVVGLAEIAEGFLEFARNIPAKPS